MHATAIGNFFSNWNVLSLDNTHPFANAGLMVRDGLAPDAVTLIVDVKPNGEIEFMARQCTGCDMQYFGGRTVALPVDLYVQRQNSTFTVLAGGYRSVQ
jgi:hypothetical protein